MSEADVKTAMDRQNQHLQPAATPTTVSASLPHVTGKTSTTTTTTTKPAFTPSPPVPTRPSTPPPTTFSNRPSTTNAQKPSTSNTAQSSSRPSLQQQLEQRPASATATAPSSSPAAAPAHKKHAPRTPSTPITAPGFVIDEALREVVSPIQPLRRGNVADLLDSKSAAAPLESPSNVRYSMDTDGNKKVGMHERFENKKTKRQTERAEQFAKDQTQKDGVSDV